MNNWSYIQDRLKEPSTWSAIAVLCGTVGYTLNIEYAMAVATAAFTLINIFWKKDTQSGGTGDGTKTTDG